MSLYRSNYSKLLPKISIQRSNSPYIDTFITIVMFYRLVWCVLNFSTHQTNLFSISIYWLTSDEFDLCMLPFGNSSGEFDLYWRIFYTLCLKWLPTVLHSDDFLFFFVRYLVTFERMKKLITFSEHLSDLTRKQYNLDPVY